MAICEILLYPKDKKKLRTKSKPTQGVTKEVKQIVRVLKDTLNAHAEGIGLAAPQINIHKRVVLIQFGTDGDENSEPGLYGNSSRPHHIRVTGIDEDGKDLDHVYEGFDAGVVHHEMDHLDGVLFINRKFGRFVQSTQK